MGWELSEFGQQLCTGSGIGELMDDQRYKEAEVVAKQVAELKPDDPIAVTMSHVARTKTRILMDQEIREKGQDAFLDTMIGIQRSANVFDPNNELTFASSAVTSRYRRRVCS